MRPLPLLLQATAGLLAGFLAAQAGTPAVPLGATCLLGVLLLPATSRGRGLLLVVLAAALGLVAAARGDETAATDTLTQRLGDGETRLLVEGTVVASDPPGPQGTAFLLDAVAFTTGAGRVLGEARLRVHVTGPLPGTAGPEVVVHPGDEVAVAGQAALLPPATNPGVYDASDAWGRRGVHVRLEVPEAAGVERVRRSDAPWATLSRARVAFARDLDEAFAARDAGLLRSLLLGDRGALDDADRRRFRDAGAAHILAISGTHVAIFVAGLLSLLRRLRCPPRPAAGLVLVGVLSFIPFTGSSAPVIRSAAGFSLFLLGRLVGREPSGSVTLAAVACGYLVLDPSAAHDPGFRMSFAAAAGLVSLAGRLRRALVPERPWLLPGSGPPSKAWVRSALAAGVAAWLASTPVAVHDLGQMGWVAVPVGLVAVPLSTFGMLLGAGAAAVHAVPLLGPLARGATSLTLDVLRAFLDVPGRLGCAQGPVARPGSLWYVLYLVAFVVAARAPRAGAVVAGVVLLTLLAHLAPTAALPPPPFVRVTLLDVGHGQAALVETPDGRRALLDAGSRDRPGIAERVVLPALHALGVETLDVVLASHADADHAGALPEVTEAIPAGVVVVPPGFPVATLDRIGAHGEARLVGGDGDVLLSGAWGRLELVGPARGPPRRRSTNDGCLVARLVTPNGMALFPGDRQTDGVDDLLRAHPELAADLLVLPHHGLPSGGRDRLVRACGARLLVASTPRASLSLLPVGTRATAETGAMILSLAPEGPTLSTPWAPPRRARGYDPGSSGEPRPPMTPVQLAIAAAALVVISLVSTRLGWLTRWGAFGAGVLGLAAVHAFGWPGLLALLAPFLVATLAGKLPGGGESEGARSLRQVAANGLPALGGVLLAWAGHPWAGAHAFAGGLAALGADTLATEIGRRYGGVPRHAVTWRALARGESGGVSLAGLVASVGGALLAPATFAASGALPWSSLPGLATAGVAAGYADSVLGALLQRKGRCATCGRVVETATCHGSAPVGLPGRLAFLDNDGVNVANGVLGAVLAVLLRK